METLFGIRFAKRSQDKATVIINLQDILQRLDTLAQDGLGYFFQTHVAHRFSNFPYFFYFSLREDSTSFTMGVTNGNGSLRPTKTTQKAMQ